MDYIYFYHYICFWQTLYGIYVIPKELSNDSSQIGVTGCPLVSEHITLYAVTIQHFCHFVITSFRYFGI